MGAPHLTGKELVMDLSQPAESAPLPPSAAPVRPRNGLGVAALVLGVASLVAGISFVLFPLALIGGVVGLIIALVALARRKARGGPETGPALHRPNFRLLAVLHRIDLNAPLRSWGDPNY